jgi:hypothetical protein
MFILTLIQFAVLSFGCKLFYLFIYFIISITIFQLHCVAAYQRKNLTEFIHSPPTTHAVLFYKKPFYVSALSPPQAFQKNKNGGKRTERPAD